MTMALLGAEVLAPFVLEALTGPTAGPELQRRASAAWERRFRRRITLCRAFHHALVHPALIDVASLARSFGSSALTAGFRLTRDPSPSVG
jgi:hypothetical protein